MSTQPRHGEPPQRNELRDLLTLLHDDREAVRRIPDDRAVVHTVLSEARLTILIDLVKARLLGDVPVPPSDDRVIQGATAKRVTDELIRIRSGQRQIFTILQILAERMDKAKPADPQGALTDKSN